MQRARGLAALLDVARHSWIAEAPPCSAALAAAARPAGLSCLAALAGQSALLSATSSSAIVAGSQLSSRPAWNARWRGLQTSAAARAVERPPKASPAAAEAAAAPAGPSATPVKHVLYRGKGMRLFRLLVRMKVFQLAGIAALAIPINTWLATGNVASTQIVMASALVVGAGVASGALWYYSRRYVGELSLLPSSSPGQPPRLRLSVLDFWGNREDNDVALQALVPPLANLPEAGQRAMLQEPLLPVDVEGDRQYFLSVRYGQLVDGPTLKALLAGQLEGQQLRADEES